MDTTVSQQMKARGPRRSLSFWFLGCCIIACCLAVVPGTSQSATAPIRLIPQDRSQIRGDGLSSNARPNSPKCHLAFITSARWQLGDRPSVRRVVLLPPEVLRVEAPLPSIPAKTKFQPQR